MFYKQYLLNGFILNCENKGKLFLNDTKTRLLGYEQSYSVTQNKVMAVKLQTKVFIQSFVYTII